MDARVILDQNVGVRVHSLISQSIRTLFNTGWIISTGTCGVDIRVLLMPSGLVEMLNAVEMCF